MVSRTRSWALATIISRIAVNAVTQILPVADENNNTRMKFTREAIKTVLADKDE